MHKFDKKQIIALIIIGTIIIGSICYYVYAEDKNEETQIINNLEIENTKEDKQQTKETILVHISGAVNKEGIVELEANSRISDAIEKARRNNTRCIYG